MNLGQHFPFSADAAVVALGGRGCSTGAEVAGTAQVPITNSLSSNSSNSTANNFRRPSTSLRRGRRSRPRRRNITPSPLRPRLHGTRTSNYYSFNNI